MPRKMMKARESLTYQRDAGKDKMMARFKMAAWSERGPREENQDYFLVDENIGAAVVSDGLGGAELGAVCARAACVAAMGALREGSSTAFSLSAANDAALKLKALLDGEQGSGTTILIARLSGANLSLAWVGDTLAFRMRGNALERLTESGRIAPWLSVLDSALGQNEPVVRGSVCDILPGDRFLLCTDGVWDAGIDDGKAIEIMAQAPSRAAMTLCLRAASVSGDNATAVVIEVAR